MSSPNSRFHLLDTLTKAPGQCGICHSVSRGPFVDTGVDDPFTGTFYICVGCLHDMAEDCDYVLTLKSDIIEPEPETESEAYKRGLLAAFGVIKEDVDGYLAVSRDTDYMPASFSDDPVPSTEVVPEDNGGQEGSGSSAGGVDREVDDAPKRKGSARVSSSSGDGSEAGLSFRL